MLLARHWAVWLGPCCGLLGLAHFMERRFLRGALLTLAGLLLLADVAQNVRLASGGEAQRLTAASAAFSSWLYTAIALWEAYRGRAMEPAAAARRTRIGTPVPDA